MNSTPGSQLCSACNTDNFNSCQVHATRYNGAFPVRNFNCPGTVPCPYQTSSAEQSGSSANLRNYSRYQSNPGSVSDSCSRPCGPTNSLLKNLLFSTRSSPTCHSYPVTTEATSGRTPPNNATNAEGCGQFFAEIDKASRSMSDAFTGMRDQLVNKQNAIKDLQQGYEALSVMNDKLKKEAVQLKRERTVSTNELEKVKKLLDEQKETNRISRDTINQQRDEVETLRTKDIEQKKRIEQLEEKNKEWEVKYNELLSAHMDQRVKCLLTQTKQANLSARMETLTKNMKSEKIKVLNLTNQLSNLQGDAKIMTCKLKLQALELKREQILKQQIVENYMEMFKEPGMLNLMMIQNPESDFMKCLLRSQQEKVEDQQSSIKATDIVAMIGQSPSPCQQQVSSVIGGSDLTPGVNQQLYQVMAEIKSLRQTFEEIETGMNKRKGSPCASTSFGKKFRADNTELPLSDFSESEHEGADESGVDGDDDDDEDTDCTLIEDQTIAQDLHAKDLQKNEVPTPIGNSSEQDPVL